MYKVSVTILLFLLVAIQTFSKWCLMAEYQVNRDFIAKNLCVNRFRPSCCCQGKCYLNKKIAADESRQQDPAKGAQKDETLLQVHTSDILLPAPVCALFNFTHHTRYLDGDSHEYIPSFFPPPRA